MIDVQGDEYPDRSDHGSAALDQLRDLSDFCQHWPALKLLVTDERLLGSGISSDSDTYRMVAWMRALADRVCPGERF